MDNYKCKKCKQKFNTVSALANHNRWHHKEKKTFICKCKKEFNDNSSFSTHLKFCDGTGTRNSKKGIKFICHKCNQEIKTNREKHLAYCFGQGKRVRSKKIGRYTEKWSELVSQGLKRKYKDDSEFRKNKLKMTRSFKPWEKMSEEDKSNFRNKARKNILKRYENGWEPKAGRCKKIKYRDFTVDGKWELIFCKWAEKNNINFCRNKERFDYVDEFGESRKYKPDFKIDKFYVEIKGYQTERDICKWRDFPLQLLIVKKNQIKEMKNDNFSIDKLMECKNGDVG